MLHAQDAVHFEFSGGVEDAVLKSKMEQHISALLTAINRAETKNSAIDYSGINIDERAAQSIGMLWNNVHFRVVKNIIEMPCLCVQASNGEVFGYQVRNIAVKMKPFDDTYAGSLNQEVSIHFDSQGVISDFNIMLEPRLSVKIIEEGKIFNDLDRRMRILHWVEQFQNAYFDKNIQFMEDFFREDAFFIVKEEHSTMGKRQYLANLRRAFSDNSYINVQFDSIMVVRHGSKPNIYGVTLRQCWYSSTCYDEGVIFIIWDFSNEESPKILVRTWQPMYMDEDEVFALHQFKIM